MPVEHIKHTETLREGTDKINQAIDQANKSEKDAAAALAKSLTVEQISLLAKAVAENTQQQLDSVVKRETDSDAMSRQAAFNAAGEDKKNLKVRLDEDYNKVTRQLSDTMMDLEGRGINVKFLGVVGDGVVDDTKAIQDALILRKPLLFPVGTYRITDELVFGDVSVVYFQGGNMWNDNLKRNVTFLYDGVDAPNKAMLRLSKSVCGVEPTSALSSTKIIGNCLLDGNNKIGYGLYSAYLTNESSIEGVSAINTLTDGIRIEKSWYAAFRDLTAKSNQGNGITIGKSGWGGINGCRIDNLRAWGNGTRGDFTEAKPDESYGVGLYLGAGCTAENITSESNYGAGLVFSTGNSSVIKAETIYLERNGIQAKNDGKTARNWGLIVVGKSNGRASVIENIYLARSVGDPEVQSVWLAGDRPVGHVELRTISFGQYIRADWDNYKLTSYVYSGISSYIEGHFPLRVDGSLNSNWNTLYVRSNGNNINNGRTATTAFLTLEKAIEVAKVIPTIKTIDCDTLNTTMVTLDFDGINREITIDGKGTAIITGTSPGNNGLNIINSVNLVNINNFSKISRLNLTNCDRVRSLNTNYGHTDSGFSGTIEAKNGNLYLDTCKLDGTFATNGTKNGIRLYNSILRLKSTTLSNYTTGRHISIAEGSTVNAEAYSPSFDNITWTDATGFVVGGNKMRVAAGVLNFS